MWILDECAKCDHRPWNFEVKMFSEIYVFFSSDFYTYMIKVLHKTYPSVRQVLFQRKNCPHAYLNFKYSSNSNTSLSCVHIALAITQWTIWIPTTIRSSVSCELYLWPCSTIRVDVLPFSSYWKPSACGISISINGINAYIYQAGIK